MQIRQLILKRKKLKLLTNEQQNSYQNEKIYCICEEKFEDKHATDKKYHKVRDFCYYTGEHRGAAPIICNLKYSVSKEIPTVFRNRSNYDYHFIIRIIKKSLMETSRKDFLIHTNFLTMISISLLYCCKKVFTLMNLWVIG